MKSRYIFSIFLLLLMLVFAGCSEEDCSLQDSTYEKFSYDNDKGECVGQTIKKDVCGNGVADGDETYCSCPKDVAQAHPTLGCKGSKGDYLEKSCDTPTKTCILSQNDQVVETTKSVELKNSDLIFDARINYYMPFIINSFDENRLELDISLFKFPSSSSNMKNIVVNEVKVEDSRGNLLGNAIYGESIVAVDDKLKIKRIELAGTSKYETIETIKIKLDVSYDKEYLDTKGVPTGKVDNKREILSASISKFEIINPTFEK